MMGEKGEAVVGNLFRRSVEVGCDPSVFTSAKADSGAGWCQVFSGVNRVSVKRLMERSDSDSLHLDLLKIAHMGDKQRKTGFDTSHIFLHLMTASG